MAGILIIYSTSTGQTAKIVDHLARRIRDQGHTVECLDVRNLPMDLRLQTYDGIIIGAPIRMMKFPRPIIRFAKLNRGVLNEARGAFFAVCMAAADTRPEAQEQIREWVGTFLRETGWSPKVQAVFAGALMYTKYNFITRLVMKRISASEGRSTDTSRDHEYTDWEVVARFADEYLALLARPEAV
jgi:menaquinone-dependent protoporphyrinogen oxidase